MGWASLNFLSICLFVCLSVCLLICLFVCLFRIVCSLQKVRLGEGLIRDSWAGLRGTLHYNLLPPKQKLLRIKCVITRISGREHCFYSRQYGMGGWGGDGNLQWNFVSQYFIHSILHITRTEPTLQNAKYQKDLDFSLYPLSKM